MADEQLDAIIIGAGQAGGPLATALARAGRRVALVERAHVGGTCINEGCTPTKTMVASARVAYLARRAADYGVQTGEVSVDMARVRERKRAIVQDFRSGSRRRITSTDRLELIAGEAQFVARDVVEVRLADGSTRRLSAPTIVINAGARPSQPDLAGSESVEWLDSTSIMELGEVPGHLLVLGGGYIGLEFSQMFRRFGSRVTIVQRGAQLLDREDPDIAEAVREIMEQDGIEVLLNASATRVARTADGLRLTVRVGDQEREVAGTHLLVATGRTPNSDRLNLAAAGVETDQRGHIVANQRLETSVPGIYVAGDIKGGPGFTHISYDDFRVLRTTLVEGGQASTADRPVPYTVYIDPQLGRVGLSEREAAEQHRPVRVARMPMSHVARALETDEPRGVLKVLVERDGQQILGCAMLGIEGGEIMSAIQIAMMGGLPYTALRDAVFAHPTLMEALNNLFGQIED